MSFQETVRDIDAGTTAKFLKIGMIAAVLAGLCTIYLLGHFKGLDSEEAMDQAQIARSLLSKEGFSTRYIRPLAIKVLTEEGKPIPNTSFPEIYNAPLFPLLEAVALLPVKPRLQMAPTDTVSTGDRAIAVLGVVLLFLGVFVWYRVGLFLFDKTLALLASGLLFVTDLLWQYALAGLPQLLLIILFGLFTLFALKARQAEEDDLFVSGRLWLAAAALMLGLMSLTHGVTAFLLPGFLAFSLIAFHTRILSFLLSLIIYLLTVSPWLIHNYLACHNPLGISLYLVFAGFDTTTSEVMRGIETAFTFGGGLRDKFQRGLIYQASHLWEFLGLNLAALVFIPSCLHAFRSPLVLLWRWFVLAMWLGLIIGLALFGVKDAVSGNQLHLLFLPIFVLYGTAFLLVLWNRLNIEGAIFRILFLCAVFLVSAAPMILTLIAGESGRIQWPPYVPPFISVLNNWYQPQELISSDMPWAVAWYANRRCLLIPETVHAFDEISDFNTLGSPIVGLYLTPISGSQKFTSLLKGPYKEWAPVIMRTVILNDFLLKSFTALPIDGECVLYADSARWARKSTR